MNTQEEIKEVRTIASRLQQLGVPQKLVDKIRVWAKEQTRQLRDEARDHPHKLDQKLD